jgi:hypothetical protein
VVKLAVVEVDGDEVEPVAAELVAFEEAEGVGAFTAPLDWASCARNRAPPKKIATHPTPIAIR